MSKIVKLNPSKALVPQGSQGFQAPEEIAKAQLLSLVKVLEPIKEWGFIKPGALSLARREEAEKTMVALRELKDTAEKGRVALTKPLLDEKKRLDDLYKGFQSAVGVLDSHVWSLIKAARDQEAAIAQKAAEKIAKAAEKKGAVQFAEDVRAQAAEPPALAVLQEQTIVRGEVEGAPGLILLVKAVAKGEVPLAVLDFNQSAINQLIRGGMTLPGVKRVEETIAKRGR